MSLENQDKLNAYLAALIEHEKTVAELYQIYAQEFPSVAVFWNQLFNEEMQHASWIAALKNNSDLTVRDRFPIEAIQTSIRYAQRLIKEAAMHNQTLVNAISLSLHLEEAMIENQFFEVFKGDSDVLADVLKMLADQTHEHLDRIRKVLSQCKPRS